MQRFLGLIKLIISDQVIFPFIETLFLIIFLNAIRIEKGILIKRGGFQASVKRGEKSWGYFALAYGIGSVVLIEIIASTEACTGYKTLIMLANLIMLLYLTFFNSWFRNKIVHFFLESQEKWEK